MKLEDWTQLHDVVVTSAISLFTSIGLSPTYAGSAPQVETQLAETVAIIGLGGELRGSLVLSVPTALLKRSHPAGGADADMTDWLMELTNLLLGRIKLRLLTRGIKTELSTPVTVLATALRVVGFPGMPVAHAFEVGSETIAVIFGAVGSDDLNLGAVAEDSIVRMGEVVLF